MECCRVTQQRKGKSTREGFIHTVAAGHDLYTPTLLQGLDLQTDQGTDARGSCRKQVKVKKLSDMHTCRDRLETSHLGTC